MTSAASNLPGARAMTIAALLGAAVIGWSGYRLGRVQTSAGPDRVVAVVEFRNLSQDPKDAWLSPTLTAMLGTELGVTNEVRVVPAELVRDVSRDLDPSALGSDRNSLAQLRKRLNADYVVSGSYRIGAASQDPLLDVLIDLRNASDGVSVAAVSKHVALSALNGLVNQTSATLRSKLGVTTPSSETLNLLANAQPPTTAVARRIGFALDAMERYDSARARDELLEAVAEAPTYAPANLYLSRAWAALGYREKALAAAEQAASHAATLPHELRLQIDAAIHADSYDWQKAAQTWKELVALKPGNLEYRLELIDADLVVGDIAGAQAALAQTRTLADAAGDPRVELAAARIASRRDDTESAAAFSTEALRQARLREAPGLIADAQLKLAGARWHLGDHERARTDLSAAIAGYRAIGNPRGEVQARRTLASVLGESPQADAARNEYQRAIALAQSIGDLGEVAAIYRNICADLWTAGDRDGAEAAARRSLQIAREIGDLQLQAWTLRALANIAFDEAATDEVMNEYREVTVLTDRSHDAGGHVWSLATNADALRSRGELDEAQDNCTRAQRESTALSDPQFAVYSGFNCAVLAFDRGEIDAARRLLERIVQLSDSSGNAIYSANAQFVLGQIEFDASRWTIAQGLLRKAAEKYAKADGRTGEANANALLALCAQALGEMAARDEASARTRALRAAITSKQEIYVVDIALAQLATGALARSQARARLGELADDAQRRHWISWSLEAKLAEWRILKADGNAAAAAHIRDELEASARPLGFGRIVALLEEPGIVTP
jgi:tetratricopeptide (TPR) repeat protein